MDQAGRAEGAEDFSSFARVLRIVVRDARIERTARTHSGIERAHGFFKRRIGIKAVRVEDVDIGQAHAPQALIEAGQHVFAAAPFAVRAVPHVVTGLGRDHDLIAQLGKIMPQHGAEAFLGRSRRRTVIVGEIEMGDAKIEGAAAQRTLHLKRRVAAEIVPESERHGWQLQARPAAAVVDHSGGGHKQHPFPRQRAKREWAFQGRNLATLPAGSGLRKALRRSSSAP